MRHALFEVKLRTFPRLEWGSVERPSSDERAVGRVATEVEFFECLNKCVRKKIYTQDTSKDVNETTGHANTRYR